VGTKGCFQAALKPKRLPKQAASMAATNQPVTLFLRRSDIDHEETEVRVRPSTELQKIIGAYAYRWNVNPDALHVQTEQGKVVTGTMTVKDVGLEDSAVLLVRVGELLPFRPSHADHSDMAFDVDGHSFLVHKFPVLKSASPLLKDMVDEYDGDPVPLHVPGGAEVFDTVARFLYKDEVNATSLFSVRNAASVRVAASYLQFDALAIAVDAFLEKDVLPHREPCLAVLHAALAVPAAEAPENGVVQRCVRSVASLVQWRRLAALASDVVTGVEAEQEQADAENQGATPATHDGGDPAQPGAVISEALKAKKRKRQEPWQWALAHLPAMRTLLSSEAAAEAETRRARAAEPSSWPSGFRPGAGSAPAPTISGAGGRCEALLMCLPPRLFLLAAATAREQAVTEARAASQEAEAIAAGRSAGTADTEQAAPGGGASALLRRADKAMGKARAVSVASALFVLYRLAAATAADVALLMAPKLDHSVAASPALQASASSEAGARDAAVLESLQQVFRGGGPAWPDAEALPPTTLAEMRRALPGQGSGSESAAEPGRQARWRALHDCADIIRLVDARALPPAVALRLLRLAQAAGAPQQQAEPNPTPPPAGSDEEEPEQEQPLLPETSKRVAAAASSIRAICGLTLASSPGTVLSLPASTLASLEPGVMCEALARARAGAPARRLLLRAYWAARVGADPERAVASAAPQASHGASAAALASASERAGAASQDSAQGAAVNDDAPGLSLDELQLLLRAAKPHFGAPTGLSAASGAVGLREEAEDDLDGDAGSGFYRAALGVILDAVAREEAELSALKEESSPSESHELAQAAMASRARVIRTLQLEGLLRLDLLPPRTLRAAMTHPGLPYQPIVDAALAQSEAVAAQLAATQAQLRRAGEAMRDSRAREGLCEHSHLPVMTAISVLRSSGQWTPARVQAFSAHSGLYSIEYRPAEGDSGPGEQRWYDLAQTRYRVEADTSAMDPATPASARVPPPNPVPSPRLDQSGDVRQPQSGRGSAVGRVPPLPLGRQAGALGLGAAGGASHSDSATRLSARSGPTSTPAHNTPRRGAARNIGPSRFGDAEVPATAIGGAADRPGSVAAAWPSDGQSQPRDSFTSDSVSRGSQPVPDPGSARLSGRQSGSGSGSGEGAAVGDDGLTASQRAGAMIRGRGGAAGGGPAPAPARTSAHSRHRSGQSADSSEPASGKAPGKRVWGAEQQLARLERAQRGQQRRHASATAAAGAGPASTGQARSSAASRRQAEVSAQINARAAAELATRDLRREAAFAADEAEHESDAMAASARAAELGAPMSGRALREAARNAMQSAHVAPHAQRRQAGRR
jgi:hypothetical protein